MSELTRELDTLRFDSTRNAPDVSDGMAELYEDQEVVEGQKPLAIVTTVFAKRFCEEFPSLYSWRKL